MELPYQQYFDAAPCYFTVQDRSLRVIEANERFRRDFGPFEGRYCYEVYKHRTEPCEVCPVMETFADGESHSSEQDVRCLDGRQVSVIVYTTPILDAEGDIAAVLEMSTDITGIKRLEHQLRHSEKRYHQLFEDVPCLINIQDENHRVVEANQQTRDVFGPARGTLCYETFKQRDEECPDCPVRDTFRDGELHHSEEVLVSRDGDPIHVLVQAAPIHDRRGRIVQVMEMATDITSIRELQSQLESLGLLISSVSHGIKGLLTGMDGGRYLVTSGLDKNNPKRVKQGWEMVQRNVDQIRNMVLNILYYAKEREPMLEAVDPEQLLCEVCRVVESRAAEHDVSVACDPGDVGVLEADPQALRSLLVNLMENGIDACRVDRKKASHQVSIAAAGTAEAVQFVVEDNGIGMDAETRGRAFSLFFSSKGSEGTGLGLFIANKIARAHGGGIRIDSAPDRGTRFVVSIPRQPRGHTVARKEATDG